MYKEDKKQRLLKRVSFEQTEEEAGLSPSYNSKRKRGIIPITKNEIISISAIFVEESPNPIKKQVRKKATLFRKFEKWFDLNLGWFFVNGRKMDSWNKKINEKHKDN